MIFLVDRDYSTVQTTTVEKVLTIDLCTPTLMSTSYELAFSASETKQKSTSLKKKQKKLLFAEFVPMESRCV